MMNNQFNAAGIGILAGLATAALSAAMTGGAGILFMLSPLPLMLAALGFGLTAGFAAAATAAGAVVFFLSMNSAVVAAVIIIIPSLLAAQLANLARPAEEIGGPSGKLIWFPLADILFFTALAAAAGFIVTGFMSGYGEEFGRELTARLVEAMGQADPQFQLDASQQEMLAKLMTMLLPVQLPWMWICILTANLYFALAVAGRAGQLQRPKDIWPIALRMPRSALAMMALAMLMTLVSGAPGYIGATIAGALGGCFMMAGFAMLHARSAGKAWRPAALGAAYASALFFMPVLLLFLMAGLTETRRPASLSNTDEPPTLH